MRGQARELVRGGNDVVCSMDYCWLGTTNVDKNANTMAVIKAVAPQEHIPNAQERVVPQYMVRGMEDRLVRHEGAQAFADALKAVGQTVEYVPGGRRGACVL